MTTAPRRRSVLVTALSVVAAVSGCSVPASPRGTAPTADPAPGKAISPARDRRALLLQVSAHPDDDLYFMNPDTQRLLDSGVPLVSVYVTAGEHTGRNRIAGMPETPPDRAAYSSARHQGLRQAYADALGLPLFTPWRREAVALGGGRHAEVATLTSGRRRVELVFLNLPMHTNRRYMAVPALWRDRALELPTHLSAGSPLTRSEPYDHDLLVDVLTGLLRRYRPTVVHTLDPDPDLRTDPGADRPLESEQPGYQDHGDHTAVACFTWAALNRWVAESVREGGPVPAFATTAFRGYYNRHWPENLPPEVLREKAGRLVPYGGDPSWACGNPSGCGDYAVGGDRPLTSRKGWVRATHHRWPGAGPALAEEPGGHLAAYGVLGLRAVRWREPAPGEWSEPEDLGGGPLAPALGSAVLADGRVLLFGVRFAALEGRGGPNRREVVLLEQRSPGGPFLAWRGLGCPEHGDDRGRRIGAPVAVTARDGRVHLFVRNADKGVSTRARAAADGSWGPWRALPGAGEVQDGLAVSLDATGRIHLYAAGHDSVRHWVDGVPDGERLPLSGSTVASVGGELYHRAPAAAELLGPDGDTGLDGYGTVAAARSAALGTVLLGTDPKGRAVLGAGGRVRTAPRSAVATALHLGTRGATVVGLGADGRPWSWRP